MALTPHTSPYVTKKRQIPITIDDRAHAATETPDPSSSTAIIVILMKNTAFLIIIDIPD